MDQAGIQFTHFVFRCNTYCTVLRILRNTCSPRCTSSSQECLYETGPVIGDDEYNATVYNVKSHHCWWSCCNYLMFVHIWWKRWEKLFNDMFMLDTTTMTWTHIEAHDEPPTPRAGHTCNVINDTLLIFLAGATVTGPTNDLYIFDMECCGRRKRHTNQSSCWSCSLYSIWLS
jgi:hypothetical protein